MGVTWEEREIGPMKRALGPDRIIEVVGFGPHRYSGSGSAGRSRVKENGSGYSLI
jgi:hypothetical protein